MIGELFSLSTGPGDFGLALDILAVVFTVTYLGRLLLSGQPIEIDLADIDLDQIFQNHSEKKSLLNQDVGAREFLLAGRAAA